MPFVVEFNILPAGFQGNVIAEQKCGIIGAPTAFTVEIVDEEIDAVELDGLIIGRKVVQSQ